LEIRDLVDQAYARLKQDPRHPSLQFKKVGKFWSARVGAHHRALAVEAPDGLVPGLVIDFNRSGKPIGIEITAPRKASAKALNRVLRRLGLPAVTRADLAPLRAA
jgi:hypothetical protein